jgi:hypothetical protein
MTPPTNTFTVTFADAHSHQVVQSANPANSKIDALLNVLQAAENEPTAYASLVTTDTWTVTVTQP